MVCHKTTDEYLKQVAAAAFQSATSAADEVQAQRARRQNALHVDIARQPDVARGAIMAQAATALSGPNAHVALFTNPSGAAYHSSLPSGLAAGMPRDVAQLLACASPAGVDFGAPSSGEVPNPGIVRRAVRKRLADTGADKRIAQVERIDGRLGNADGASSSARVCVLDASFIFGLFCARPS